MDSHRARLPVDTEGKHQRSVVRVREPTKFATSRLLQPLLDRLLECRNDRCRHIDVEPLRVNRCQPATKALGRFYLAHDRIQDMAQIRWQSQTGKHRSASAYF
jgi:hypothetical protein